jgi:hypothetical protein
MIAQFDLLVSWTSTEIYVMLSFMSWLPNLLIAELLVGKSIGKKLMQRKKPT